MGNQRAMHFASAQKDMLGWLPAGTVAGTAPSTAHQIVLDLRPEARLSFAFEPPGYQLHYWREGTGLVTHTAAIGDWPGPYFYSKKPATD